MSNSTLISGTLLNHECSNPRTGKIKKITIHHMAGVMSAMDCARMHKSMGGVSANYYIGNGGEIVLGVEESRRAWTSDSRDNDYQAVTIEVSNSKVGEPWPVSEQAYNSLIRLCADICKRNGITLKWTGTSSGTLTTHDMFMATGCPGTYLKSRMGQIAQQVNEAVSGKVQKSLTDTEQIHIVSTGETWVSVGKLYGIDPVYLLEYNNFKTANAVVAKNAIKLQTLKVPAKWVPGDVDGDGKVTAKDARTILRASARLAALTPAQRMRADVDADGRVTAKDARAALRASARLQ